MPDDRSRGSDLCTQCGLCCNGALHNFAKLEPEEVEYASGLGLTLRASGRPGFALPCPMLEGTLCSIYGDRPKVCSRYKCQLLQDLEAGAVTLDAAIGKVGTAKELVRQAETLMPEGITLPGARALSQQAPDAATDLSGRAGGMALRLAITALSLYIDKHFKNSREGKLLSLEPVGEGQPDTEMT